MCGASDVHRNAQSFGPGFEGATAMVLFVIVALLATPTIGLAAGDTMVYLYPDVSPSARGGVVIRVLKDCSMRLVDWRWPTSKIFGVSPRSCPPGASESAARHIDALSLAGRRPH